METKAKLILVLILFGLFYFIFLGDYLKYRNVIDKQSTRSIIEYYSDYPNGWYIEEVRVEEVLITSDIELVRDFITEYPESQYLYKIETLRLKLWDSEIEYFNLIISKEHSDTDAITFFRNLLYFMRDHKQSEILLNMSGQIELLDFDDYPQYVQDDWDVLAYDTDYRTISHNVLDLKSNYSKGSISAYENIISNSIESSFENILQENFIKVNNIYSSSSDTLNNKLKINIEYKISNQVVEGEPEYPNIWTYTNDDKFQSYILGIDISYKFNFIIPNIDSYEFSLYADPSNSVEGFDNISEAYEIMTKQNFTDFANKINTKFGIHDKIRSLPTDN